MWFHEIEEGVWGKGIGYVDRMVGREKREGGGKEKGAGEYVSMLCNGDR